MSKALTTGKGGIAGIRTANKLPFSPQSSEIITSRTPWGLARVGLFVIRGLIFIRKMVKTVLPCFVCNS